MTVSESLIYVLLQTLNITECYSYFVRYLESEINARNVRFVRLDLAMVRTAYSPITDDCYHFGPFDVTEYVTTLRWDSGTFGI